MTEDGRWMTDECKMTKDKRLNPKSQAQRARNPNHQQPATSRQPPTTRLKNCSIEFPPIERAGFYHT